MTLTDEQQNEQAALSARAYTNVQWFTETYKEQLARIDNKEGANGAAPIDMMTAENWLGRDKLVGGYQKAVQSSMTSSHLSYAPGFGGDPDLLAAAAGFFNRFFKPAQAVLPAHVVVGAGCSALVESLVYDLCEADEGVLVEVPYWSGFEMACMLRPRVRLIPVEKTGPSTDASVDGASPDSLVAAYEQALNGAGCRVRAILLCNPHNPRGQPYSATQLTALVAFCHRHQLHLISDEIYGLSTFGVPPDPGSSQSLSPARALVASASPYSVFAIAPPATSFTPVMSLPLPDPARVHTLHGISKDLGSSGLRVGFLVTQSNPVLRMSQAIANHAKVSTVSTLMATTMLADQPRLHALVDAGNAALRHSASLVVDFLVAHHVPFYQPVAGVFIWARLGHGFVHTAADEMQLARAFRAAGVELVTGVSCREPRPGWFRITFALDRPQLLAGLERIAGVLDMFHGPKQ